MVDSEDPNQIHMHCNNNDLVLYLKISEADNNKLLPNGSLIIHTEMLPALLHACYDKVECYLSESDIDISNDSAIVMVEFMCVLIHDLSKFFATYGFQ